MAGVTSKSLKPERDGCGRVWEHYGIYDCTFHDTRRTYASRLVGLGVSLPIIAKLLGHGATYVTERYAHVSDGALGAAVVRLDDRESSRFSADEEGRKAQAEHPVVTPHP